MSTELNLAQSSLEEGSQSTPKIQRVLTELSQQRDRSIEKVKALQTQNIQLQAQIHELGRFKELAGVYEREVASLKVSLESSERIRIQQKDLIRLLQENGGRTLSTSLNINNSNNTLEQSFSEGFSFVDNNQYTSYNGDNSILNNSSYGGGYSRLQHTNVNTTSDDRVDVEVCRALKTTPTSSKTTQPRSASRNSNSPRGTPKTTPKTTPKPSPKTTPKPSPNVAKRSIGSGGVKTKGGSVTSDSSSKVSTPGSAKSRKSTPTTLSQSPSSITSIYSSGGRQKINVKIPQTSDDAIKRRSGVGVGKGIRKF
jgi:hypothetical protein